MKKLEKLQKIKDVLVEIYGETLAPSWVNDLADEIYDCAYADGYDLDNIVSTLLGAGIGSWVKAYDVFHEVIHLMDNNALTAKKLYKCFLENFLDLDVLCKLLNWNEEWLTPDEKERIKEAAKCYDNETLKLCIWDWEDED